MAGEGTLCIGDKWLAGLMAALGCECAEAPMLYHDGSVTQKRFYLRTLEGVSLSTVIGAWDASKKGQAEFVAFQSTLTDPECVKLCELVNLYYCALVMANRYDKCADGNEKMALRKDGELKAILPVNYGPMTAEKYGLPYPPKRQLQHSA